MTPISVTTASPEATMALAERLGRAAQAGDVIALIGELGAGKTVFAKGILAGLGGDPRCVTSPTFVLMMRHEARLPLFHFDAYRLARHSEMLDIGAEEAYYGTGVCVIEWADRVAESLPADRLEVSLEVESENERKITLTPCGKSARALIKRAGL